MSAAAALLVPAPSPAQRRFLVHMQACDGGWLPEDPVRIKLSTVIAVARLGWVTLERDTDGWICSASITAKGVAAYRWGSCDVFGA